MLYTWPSADVITNGVSTACVCAVVRVVVVVVGGGGGRGGGGW